MRTESKTLVAFHGRNNATPCTNIRGQVDNLFVDGEKPAISESGQAC